jgi:hypothetical protein
MESSGAPVDVRAFVAQHNPSKSRIFALVQNSDHFSGFVTLEAVATVSDPSRADELCAALNHYIYDRDEAQGFAPRLRALLDGEPESINAAMHQILDRIKRSGTPHRDHLVKTISPFGSFPLSACPPAGCPACGECVNSCKDCVACGEFDPDLECECGVHIPPRTASLIHAMAENYCDTIHDLAEDIPSAIPLKPHADLWPIPEVAWWQSRDFYRKFARAFEDIARDIEDGQEPDPHNMAEEIALHLVLDAAAGIVADEASELELFTGGMPKSRFDFDFDLLHDVLYQDKDYEIAYIGNRTIAKPGDLEEWFEDFQTPAPRDPERGFRR